MTSSEEPTQFFDAEHRFDASKLDYKWVLMQAVNQVRMAASTEMGPGRVEERQGTHGKGRVYVPDSREVLINSVRVLADLLLPYHDAIVEKELSVIGTLERDAAGLLRKEYAGGGRNDVFRLRDHIVRMRLRYARQRFRSLIKLMSRADLIDHARGRRKTVGAGE